MVVYVGLFAKCRFLFSSEHSTLNAQGNYYCCNGSRM